MMDFVHARRFRLYRLSGIALRASERRARRNSLQVAVGFHFLQTALSAAGGGAVSALKQTRFSAEGGLDSVCPEERLVFVCRRLERLSFRRQNKVYVHRVSNV